ncbi:MAG: helix-turn-helix domain-containing protein [Pseudomonadota bacterium]
MMMSIDAKVLKSVRKARKVGRPKLAKLTGLTERQLSKLEGAVVTELAPAQMMRISDALQVPAVVLSGEEPVSDLDMMPLATPCCSNKGCCG